MSVDCGKCKHSKILREHGGKNKDVTDYLCCHPATDILISDSYYGDRTYARTTSMPYEMILCGEFEPNEEA